MWNDIATPPSPSSVYLHILFLVPLPELSQEKIVYKDVHICAHVPRYQGALLLLLLALAWNFLDITAFVIPKWALVTPISRRLAAVQPTSDDPPPVDWNSVKFRPYIDEPEKAGKLAYAQVDTNKLFEMHGQDEEGRDVWKFRSPKSVPLRLRPILGDVFLPPGKERFLPVEIIIRNDMNKYLHHRLSHESMQVDRHNILIGPPGTGKSVLAFLTVLQVAHLSDTDVLFIRATLPYMYDGISLFWMSKSAEYHSLVDVRSIRTMYTTEVYSVTVLTGKTLRERFPHFTPFERREVVKVMVDGPRWDETGGDLTDLITSGGYPSPKDEVSIYIKKLVLGSWPQKDLVRALRLIKKTRKKEAQKIYYFFGGSIRTAFHA